MTTQSSPAGERVLVLTPLGRDAALACKVLAEEGISAYACRDMNDLCQELQADAGAALLTEEVLNAPGLKGLLKTLGRQEIWSDLPLILFTSSEEAARFFLEAIGPRLNVTILARPINIAILISVLRSALRARRRQYQMRDLLLKLESANQAKDEFLATVSHELRTPLNAMMGWAGMLRSGNLDELTKARGLEVLQRNTKLQAQLIDDLLDISRIISGKLRLDVQAVDLAQVVRAAVDVVRPAADAKEIRLQIELDPQAGPVSGDPGRMQQVVWNLLSNAVKFTPREGRIQVRLRRLNSHAEIMVSDSGLGIDSEFLPHVFDRFRQADGTRARRHGGLGLGLAIVRHLVELQGGTVSAFSGGPDEGATFTVQLPITTTHGAGRAAESPESKKQVVASSGVPFDCPPALAGFRLLAVEDDQDARDLIVTILRQCQAEVKGVASAEEAMAALEEWQPDVLLSDIEMPGEDGYSLIRRVRSEDQKRVARIPAVALTAQARAEDRMRALSAGYDAHIAKPVEPAELITVIASLTRRSDR
jgi:signal transduction histidine kinase/ActR/RegA family two-component response regulator